MHEDLQKRILLSEETSLRIQQMGNVEIHELRLRKATTQCPLCSDYVPEGVRFCKCGAGLQLVQATVLKINLKFSSSPGSYYVLVFNKTRGKKHGGKQYQVDHHRAKDTLRRIRQSTNFVSILDRFQRHLVQIVSIGTTWLDGSLLPLSGLHRPDRYLAQWLVRSEEKIRVVYAHEMRKNYPSVGTDAKAR